MRWKAEYLLALFFIRLIQLLPLEVAVRVGALIGRLFYRFDRRHRAIALEGLRASLGDEKSEPELEQIASEALQNLGRSVVEFAWVQSHGPDELMRRTTIEGLEHYTAAERNKKGIIFLTAHFGNWEWMATSFPLYAKSTYVVARPLDNPYLNRMINAWRERYGNKVLNKRSSAAEMMRLLKAGEAIGILLDQNTAESEAVFVDFFGRPAATHKGMAILALRTGAAVLPAFNIREEGRCRVIIQKPLDIVRTGDLERDIREATALFTRAIESAVRSRPDHWLWVHRRWKTQKTERRRESLFVKR